MTKNIWNKSVIVALCAILCSALWGSAFSFIKLGYRLFVIDSADTASQILFAGIRFTLAGILTVIFGSIISRQLLIPKKESAGRIFRLSLVQTVLQYIFFYIGLAHTSGVNASIIEGVNIFIAIVIASLIFKQEELNAKKIIGCVLGFAGIVLVNLSGGNSFTNLNLLGDGSILMSAIAYAFSSAIIKKYSEYENPVVLSGYQFAVGGTIMTIAGLIFGGRITTVSLGGMSVLFYLAFVSAFSYSLWGILLKYNDVSKVTIYAFTNPLFGVLCIGFCRYSLSQSFRRQFIY